MNPTGIKRLPYPIDILGERVLLLSERKYPEIYGLLRSKGYQIPSQLPDPKDKIEQRKRSVTVVTEEKKQTLEDTLGSLDKEDLQKKVITTTITLEDPDTNKKLVFKGNLTLVKTSD